MLYSLKTLPRLAAGAAAVALCAAVPAVAAETPAATSDGEWLSLSGSVVSTAPESFMLDYGSKTIRVEMDDYDWYLENPILEGDQVIVTGQMDADFWQNRTIEASSVYVKSLNTMYFASAADEEGAVVPILSVDPLTDGESVSLTGTVRQIVGDELTLDAGLMNYRVDTASLDYDPLDDDGVQHIAVGDRISVFGRMDDADLFDRREIDAKVLTELG